MAGPPPQVAAVRVAVRKTLNALPDGALALVACSGGADSAALAAATAFEAPRSGRRAGLVTIDHGLQAGSSERAGRVAAWGAELGLEPVEALSVQVGAAGGPEAAARDARYHALAAAAERTGAAAVLLGHTRDDQAETVLLALARGSGARSLAGMAPERGIYHRPLLRLPRATVHAAASHLPTWDDPHNTDPAYARARVRVFLHGLNQAAPGAIDGLARSSRLLRADADLLDELASGLRATACGDDGSLDCAALAAAPPALRTRVLHSWAAQLGGAPTAAHVDALDVLVVGWRGQGAVSLAGGRTVTRVAGRLRAASG